MIVLRVCQIAEENLFGSIANSHFLCSIPLRALTEKDEHPKTGYAEQIGLLHRVNKDIVADRHLYPSLPFPSSTTKSQLLQVRVAARRNVVTQTDEGIRLHWTTVQGKDL